MTSTQVVKTSVSTINNSPSQDNPHLNNQTTLSNVTPWLKAFDELGVAGLPRRNFYFTNNNKQIKHVAFLQRWL